MSKFVRGVYAVALAAVAGIGSVGCVAEMDDETAELQEDSAEQVGEAKGAACSVRAHKVRWDVAGVYSIAHQDPSFLIKKKYLNDTVTGPRGGRGNPSGFNSHTWTIVNVNGGYANGYMRDDALNPGACH